MCTFDSNPSYSILITVMSCMLHTHRMQLMLEQLTHKLESVDTQLQHMATPQHPPPPSAPQAVTQGSAQSEEESNKSYLFSLDEDQVIRWHVLLQDDSFVKRYTLI